MNWKFKILSRKFRSFHVHDSIMSCQKVVKFNEQKLELILGGNELFLGLDSSFRLMGSLKDQDDSQILIWSNRTFSFLFIISISFYLNIWFSMSLNNLETYDSMIELSKEIITYFRRKILEMKLRTWISSEKFNSQEIHLNWVKIIFQVHSKYHEPVFGFHVYFQFMC